MKNDKIFRDIRSVQQPMFLAVETLMRHEWSSVLLATRRDFSTCPPDKRTPQVLLEVSDWLRGHFKEVGHRVVYKVALAERRSFSSYTYLSSSVFQ